MFKATTLLVSFTIIGASDFASSSVEQVKALWESFKQTNGKVYSTMAEELSRFEKFKHNLALIDNRNIEELANGGSAVHGITQFSDMSQEEFVQIFLSPEVVDFPSSNSIDATDIKPYTGPAGLVDWTAKYTTPVKNQGGCGSCWAFSASEQIESDAIRQHGWGTSSAKWLSPEQLVDCDTRSSGCSGGLAIWAFEYVQKVGGIELESDYPYTANKSGAGSCKATSSKYKVGVSEYTKFPHGDEINIGKYVKSTGTVAVDVDASKWNTYTGGVMSSCGNTTTNHAVQVVGVDTSSSGYWKVRNSWGGNWGEAGFIRLKYGQNTCNIAFRAVYTKTFLK